ncbi:MAG TPA: single-stranded-DNA-specific exonuclease RecJ [Kiritimatiellia bacterium]|nr:single-stranded-DNA-specific exonuclease RecJ [Kiritimatiellia bacterium]HMO97667.1 single-stranded-DNA-specific exonuclease RecJ [Kiritimatiellia bacterium]HMP95528.1 single-stranded-DNA-specific exonuclease RecJ [Kiritimatiellia bacterium]
MSGAAGSRENVWTLLPQDEPSAAALAAETGCPGWLAATLVRRGILSGDDLQRWLHPRLADLGDPLVLPDMEPAIRRILQAITAGQRITIFGDYDVDGITGSALLADVLTKTGAAVATFLPHRLEEGYGLSPEALQRCLEETCPALIITVDCGTGSVEAVETAREAGVDVIVTDHHTVGDAVAPALAVINPRRASDTGLHVLAGVGVAFKVAHALLKLARRLADPPAWAAMDPKALLDLVALGTVCDLVPLTGENRILVSHGLKVLSKTDRAGLRALMEVAKTGYVIGPYEVGFLLGPRLNAAGRLGTAQTALRLLRTDHSAEAVELAAQLDRANRERQSVERATVEDVQERVARRFETGACFAFVEADPGWHPGVVGIVASRIMQKHGRPTIIIGADDQGRAKGSGRSISGFNLVDALTECRSLLVKHGGHAMAAGLEIDWDNIDRFREAFGSVAARDLCGRSFVPELKLDGWIGLDDLTPEVLGILGKLGPYGIGNPEPVWGCRKAEWAVAPREVGSGHLKARFKQRVEAWDAIGFGLYQSDLSPDPVDLVFAIRRECYRGRESMVLHLKDLRESG